MNKPTPWYDNKQEITEKLRGPRPLYFLNEIIKFRERANKKDSGMQHPWHDFLIAGQLLLERDGKTSILSGRAIPHDFLPLLNLVVDTVEESDGLIEPFFIKSKNTPIIPSESSCCPHCKLGWTIETCTDFKYILDDEKRFPQGAYTGSRLDDVIKAITMQNLGKITVPHPAFPVHNPQKPERKDLPGSYMIEPGDTMYLQIYTLLHKRCFTPFIVRQEAEEIAASFEQAGIRMTRLLLVEHQMTGIGLGLVWHAQLPFGILKIINFQMGSMTLDGTLCGMKIGSILGGRPGFRTDLPKSQLSDILIELKNAIN